MKVDNQIFHKMMRQYHHDVCEYYWHLYDNHPSSYIMSQATYHRKWSNKYEDLSMTKDEISKLPDLKIRFLALDYHPEMDIPHEDFIKKLKIKNLAGLEHGKRQGWWDDHDGENPIKRTKIQFEEWKEQTMAHVMAHLKWFSSVSQARKNGWDKPVEKGIFKVAKKQLEIQ